MTTTEELYFGDDGKPATRETATRVLRITTDASGRVVATEELELAPRAPAAPARP